MISETWFSIVGESHNDQLILIISLKVLFCLYNYKSSWYVFETVVACVVVWTTTHLAVLTIWALSYAAYNTTLMMWLDDMTMKKDVVGETHSMLNWIVQICCM